MNYNNKRKPLQVKPLENMMLDRSKIKLPRGRSSLYSVLLVGMLAGAVPLSAIASPQQPPTGSGTAFDASRKALEAEKQKSAQEQAAKAEAEAKAKADAEAKIKADQEKSAFWQTLRTSVLWALALLLGLAAFYALIRRRVSKPLEDKISELKRSDQNTKRLVSESAKKQAEHLKHAFADIEQLKQQVQQLRQLQQQPALSGGLQREADLDFPTLQSTAPVATPQQTIDKEDLIALQQAFLEWRANSRAKKMTDCLPSSFLQKIKALDYEIVFAKAGVGLERMIIDRKPPSSTRMVGLTSHSHSIMYCYEHTYQGDELWTPNTWNEVSIDDVPDSAGEQTIHKLKELSA